jgi:hypothetical protein
VNGLLARLEEYDPTERAETLDYLRHSLNETRASLGAELAFGTKQTDAKVPTEREQRQLAAAYVTEY